MAKDTPNTPDGEAITPAEENLIAEQTVPGNEPPAAETPPPGDVVVTAEKIAELAANRREAEKAAQAEQTTEGEKADVPAEEQAATAPAPKRRGGRPPKNKGDTPAVEPSEQAKEAAEGEKSPVAAEAPAADEQAATVKKGRGGRPPKADKTEPTDKTPPTAEKKTRVARPPKGIPKAEPPAKEPEPEIPPEPVEAPRPGETEEITYISLSELFPFKDHPFGVRDDAEMRAMVESVKDKGVTQPAIVRPREGGGYEIVSGHRRQKASELAGFKDIPCIVRNLTDEQAITQMVEDNTNQRENILPSEKAKALKMQLEAIKRQGSRDGNGNGQRSNEIVAQRNNMPVKTLQRYIKLNDLVPDLMKYVDQQINGVRIGFIPAFEMSYIKPKNQQYIAIAVEGQQATPNVAQAKRMRELDQAGKLNPDMIDGILIEQKKEVTNVILSTQELSQFFGKTATPREMKDAIMRLLDENKTQLKALSEPEKKPEQEKA